MSISGISFSGLASGIDTESIIEKLMLLERQPQTLVKNKVEDMTEKNSILATLGSKIAALQDTVDTLHDPSAPFFSKSIATSTQAEVASAVVTGSQPVNGSYQLSVTQMATAAMLRSQEALYTGADATAQPARFTSSAAINLSGQTIDPTQSLSSQSAYFTTAPQSSGVVTINGTDIAWDDSMSLNTIIGNINNASLGVTATFDAVNQEISLTSNQTGSTASITLDQSSGNLWEALNITPDTAAGSDAVTTSLYEPLNSADAHLDIAVTSGTFTINNVIFNVDADTDTLRTVLIRINNSSAGVTATYNGDTGQIMLNQKNLGSDQKIILGAAGDTSNILYALKLSDNNPPVGGAQDTFSGTDAVYSLNGGAAQTAHSNEISDLIPGVEINLQGVGNTTVQVSADVDSMVETIQTFISQYNDIMDYINTKTREERVDDPTTAAERVQGTFSGDSVFLGIKSDFSDIISGVVSGLSNTLNQLAQVGITTTSTNYGKDATLELDETKLRAALASDPEGVDAVFNDATNGIITKLDQQIYALTNVVDGTLTLEENYYTSGIDDLNERIDEMETRLLKREETLQKQYAAMESLISELQSQGDQLTQMLGSSSSS